MLGEAVQDKQVILCMTSAESSASVVKVPCLNFEGIWLAIQNLLRISCVHGG
jgi:hypothetical protein